jgi:hypothetical protein
MTNCKNCGHSDEMHVDGVYGDMAIYGCLGVHCPCEKFEPE